MKFFDGASSGQQNLIGPGVGTYSTASLATGWHPDITADYGGDGNFRAALGGFLPGLANQWCLDSDLVALTHLWASR